MGKLINKENIALIFGVSGQDGGYLAEFLINKGYKVFGTTRSINNEFYQLRQMDIFNKVFLHEVDTSNFDSVYNLISKILPNEIYNLSGQSSVSQSFIYPVDTFYSQTISAINILESVRIVKNGIKIFNAGSGEIFGNAFKKPFTEDSLINPLSPYAVSKASCFYYTKNYRIIYNIFCCTGILFNHESPYRTNQFILSKVISTLCRIYKGSEEKLQVGNISVIRDWGWAPDYVEAMWLSLQNIEPDDYIFATGKSYSLKQFIEIAFNELQLDWSLYTEVDPFLTRSIDVVLSRANPSKANKVLGWYPKNNIKSIIQLLIKEELAK